MSGKVDNKKAGTKAWLRRKYTNRDDKVLDLFCGKGVMYFLAYRDRVSLYHGVDKEKIFSSLLCTKMDNKRYLSGVTNEEISQYNVFDLDAYSSPFDQLSIILKKHQGNTVKVFLTDGRGVDSRRNKTVRDFDLWAEGLPKGTEIHGNGQFALRHHVRGVWKIASSNMWELTNMKLFLRDGKQVVYSFAQLEKKNN